MERPPSKPVSHAPSKADKEDEAHRLRMRAYATSLYEKSKPIAGTLSETYLNKRGIYTTAGANIRFLPKIKGRDEKGDALYTPALLAFALDKNKAIHHVQIVRLNAKGEKNTHIPLVKQTYGKPNGRAIELSPSNNQDISLVTEGVETGLSIRAVKPDAHIMASLGKGVFKKLDIDQLSQKVIFCLDNDGSNKQPDKIVSETAKRLEEAGKEVFFVRPLKEKTDFNDLLKQEGAIALNRQLNEGIQPIQVLRDELAALEKAEKNKQKSVNQEAIIVPEVEAKGNEQEIAPVSDAEKLKTHNVEKER